MTVESEAGTAGEASAVVPAALPLGGTTNTPTPAVPPAAPTSTPSAETPKKQPRKRARAVSQREALNTPGGTCVDEDCPQHGKGRAPKKCIETGVDIWPRMTEKEAMVLTREMLKAVNNTIQMLSGDKPVPPTEDDVKGASHATAEIIHRRLGSIARYSDIAAFILAMAGYTQMKMAEIRQIQKQRAKDEKNKGAGSGT